ncbi:MAG: hypothetical protein IJ693_09995 [Bacteroidaceae bacterium]|nr:hypothetical protein [Bacteroidaceae bacterium]
MKRLILLILCTVSMTSIQAQRGLNINALFEGKVIDKSRLTETLVRGEQLEAYHLTAFHSIKFTASEKERDLAEKAFYADMTQNDIKKDKGTLNSEMENQGGHLYYAIIEVKPDTPFDRRYICYQCSEGTHGTYNITLVCLEGKVSLQDLRRMFKKKI